MTRPRVRGVDGSGEVPVPAYQLFNGAYLLGRLALEKMLAGVSTRRYPAALEPVGRDVTEASRSTSRSAVSRRFVAMTETALTDLLVTDLSGVDLVAIMVDGVHFVDHLCVVALGIDIDGVKHPLGVVEGSAENSTVVKDLLVGLRERGLDVTRPVLAVLDGAKALVAAVTEVFDQPASAGASCTSCAMFETGCPRRCAESSRSGCGTLTTPAPPSKPKACSRTSPPSWSGPTPAPRAASAKAWPRR